MNAELGIYLRKSDRELHLSKISPPVRTWGGLVIESDEPDRFAAAGLDGVEFQLRPLREYGRSMLPAHELAQGLEYAAMKGPALQAYAFWLWKNEGAGPLTDFETGLLHLLNRLKFWAMVFNPDPDRHEAIVTVSADEAMRMLRRETQQVAESDGFVALRA